MRPSVIVVAIGVLAAGGGLAYLSAKPGQTAEDAAGSNKPTHATAATHTSTLAPAPTDAAASTSSATHMPPSSGESASPETPAAPVTIAQQIKDTESTDAKIRAAAIAALANAPKEQAMPALQRVLENGEPNVDRHIALQSMYSLALRDGDPNGQIRDVMRSAIYHGDDDGVTQTAQSLLDDIEAELTQREQSKRQ
jgi:hypothetical protein